MCIPIEHGESGVKRIIFRLVTYPVYIKLLFDNPISPLQYRFENIVTYNFDHNNTL